MDYEELRDSLICSKNDEIDNASHDIICVIANEKEEQEKLDAVTALMNALMPEGVALPENAVDVKKLLKELESKVLSLNLVLEDDDETIAWDMNYIADITQIVETAMDDAGIGTCHPFFTEDDEENENWDDDNDGVLCCLSCDKCDHCSRSTE